MLINCTTEPSTSVWHSQDRNGNESSTLNKGPKDLISEDTYLQIRLIIGGFITLLVNIFGVFSNVMNCLVFFCQGLQDRTNMCLFSLALSDFLHLTCVCVYSFCTILIDLKLDGLEEDRYLTVVLYQTAVVYALKTTSGLYVMIIAVDRCICVLFPLHAGFLLKTRTMRIILITFAIIPPVGFAIQPRKYDVIKISVGGVSQWRAVPSVLWLHNSEAIDAVVVTTFGVCVPFITFVIIITATCVTVIQLTLAIAWRRKTSSVIGRQNNRQVMLTKTLVLASAVYIFCMTPFILVKLGYFIDPEFSSYGAYTHFYKTCNVLANVFPGINSFVSVFIYYNRSTRYKTELAMICNLHRNKSGNTVCRINLVGHL